MPQSDKARDTRATSSLFDQRWLAMSLAAAGAVAATSTAHAALVTFNGPVTWPNSITGAFVNPETGASGTTYAAVNGGNAAAPALNFWGTSANRVWLYPTASTTNALVGATGNITVKSPGNTVGPGDTYIPSATGGSPASPANTTWNTTAGFEGYMGFRFINNAGNATYYGYAHVRYNAWTGTTNTGGTLLDWGYDNAGGAVTIVPEPTGLAALAAGAAGVLWRRRNKVA